MIVGTYLIAVVFFTLVFVLSRILNTLSQIAEIMLLSLETISDHTLPDKQKGKLIQRASLGMLKQSIVLLLKVLIILTATALPFWVADYLDIADSASTLEFSSRADVLILTTAIAIALWLVIARVRSRKKEHEESTHADIPYSALDRAIHNLAFGSRNLRRLLLNIENRLFRAQWQGISIDRPVFITSLPRAGTTILLETLSTLPGVATHTYRDMPFLLTPMIWDALSRKFQRRSALKERVHGDGLEVNEDSPEAFEEVLWTTFFPHKYNNNSIDFWSQPDSKFANFFGDHLRKIIAIRSPQGDRGARYLSKNNANIARVPALLAMHPDAFIVIPVRDPMEHAISMLRQHQNFLERHRNEPFVKKYMGDIGHYEFGELHFPINFPLFDELCSGRDRDSLDYWLSYWLSAYEYLASIQGVHFLSYEQFASSTEEELWSLCRLIQLDVEDSDIVRAAMKVGDIPPKRHWEYDCCSTLRARAVELHSRLLGSSCNNKNARL